MKAICYNLELKSPVLATDIEGEPNSAVSLPYISGALLRGAVVGRYLKTKQSFEAGGVEERALFLSDDTRFLNAYPLRNGKRALPTPLPWRHDKNDGHDPKKENRKIHNLSCIKPEDIGGRRIEGKDLLTHVSFQDEAVEGRFVWLDGNSAYLSNPLRQLNVHTQRDARKGRATEEAGAVYRYDALASGLLLRGVILTTDERATQVAELLRGATLSIGRARGAGYGEVLITEEVEVFDYWRETETYESAGDQLQITFTSNALLRDENGQATLCPRGAIAARLGISPESLILLPEFTRAESKIVGGFNRKWGLPLPQTTAIAAGSVFTYKTLSTLTPESLDELEQQGIGERRTEGFGRLLVNWHLGPLYYTKKAELSETPKLEPLSNDENMMAEKIAERLLRRRLDEELRILVNYTKLKSPPARSQLSRLRVILRDIQTGRAQEQTADIKRLETYFQRLDSRSAGKQFRDARVFENGELAMNEKQQPATLSEWVLEQIRKAIKNWSSETVRFGGVVDDVVVKIEKNATPAMAEEYALRLIDQVLYRAAKDQKIIGD